MHNNDYFAWLYNKDFSIFQYWRRILHQDKTYLRCETNIVHSLLQEFSFSRNTSIFLLPVFRNWKAYIVYHCTLSLIVRYKIEYCKAQNKDETKEETGVVLFSVGTRFSNFPHWLIESEPRILFEAYILLHWP